MFTFQLKTQVASKLDAMIRKKPIGRLKSGSDIQFFLNSAITHAQNGRARAIDFDIREFVKMIDYNKQKITESKDADDIAALTALNDVLAEMAGLKKPKKPKPEKPEAAADAVAEATPQPDESLAANDPDATKPPKPARKPKIATISGKTISIDNLNLSTLHDAWNAINDLAPPIPDVEEGFIEHYARMDFESAMKLSTPELKKKLDYKLNMKVAASGNAGAMYDALDVLFAVHEKLTLLAPINDNSAVDRLEAQEAEAAAQRNR